MDRLFPAQGNIGLDVTSYGGAFGYAFRRVGLALGAGVQLVTLEMEATNRIFSARGEKKFQPPDFSTPDNLELVLEQSGKNKAVGVSGGLLWTPNRQVAVGLSYQYQPSLAFRTQTVTGAANVVGAGVTVVNVSDNTLDIPDQLAVGVMYRPNPHGLPYPWLLSVQYDLVKYSNLRKGFRDVIAPPDEPEGQVLLERLRISDANRLRAGGELTIPIRHSAKPVALAVRGGLVYDPQHQAYFQPDNAQTGWPSPRLTLYLPRGRDTWHGSSGVGVSVGVIRIDFAADLASTGSVYALSTVIRAWR